MNELDEISKKMLAWYGGNSTPGVGNQPADATASSDSSQESTKESDPMPSSRIATALCGVLRNGTTNSTRPRPVLILPNKPAKTSDKVIP